MDRGNDGAACMEERPTKRRCGAWGHAEQDRTARSDLGALQDSGYSAPSIPKRVSISLPTKSSLCLVYGATQRLRRQLQLSARVVKENNGLLRKPGLGQGVRVTPGLRLELGGNEATGIELRVQSTQTGNIFFFPGGLGRVDRPVLTPTIGSTEGLNQHW